MDEEVLVGKPLGDAVSSAVHGMALFRKCIDDEIERSVPYGQLFSVLCLIGLPGGDRKIVQRAVVAQLCRVDAVAWSADDALYVLLPEAGDDEAITVATPIRARLDRGALRIGRVTCLDNGGTADALIERARDAAVSAAP